MDHPPLPPGIAVLPGTDVEAAWERFYPFEALHHLHEICNPMRHTELAEVADVLAPADDLRVIDIACGHGDLLLFMAGPASIHGVGVDLSPWALLRARARACEAAPTGTLEWWLGDGKAVPQQAQWNIATCLGASWIWHGFAGTARALAGRLRPGGRLAIGDLRLRRNSDRKHLQDNRAPQSATPTGEEQTNALSELGLNVIAEIVAPDEAWEQYHETVIASAEAFARDHPDADYRHLATAWMEDFQRDRRYLTWSVWVAEKK